MKISISVQELIKKRISVPIAEAFIVSTVESERFVEDYFEDPDPFIKDLLSKYEGKVVSWDEERIETAIRKSLEKNLAFYKARPFNRHRENMLYTAYQDILKDEFPVIVIAAVLLDAFPAFWDFLEEAARRHKHMAFMMNGGWANLN